jgi:hypothetical protein
MIMSDKARAISLSDLGQLTMRGNVAFAVRCAQRMRPRFKLPADAPRRRERLAAVDGAIRVAEAFCRGLPAETGQAAAAVRAALLVAEEASKVTGYAGYAAVHAAKAAADAEEALRSPTNSGMIEVVASAFGANRVLSANTDAFTLELVLAAIYSDVEKLIGMAQGTCADLGPPIDPSESGPLGPLWPDVTPFWYTPDAGKPARAGD